MWTVIRILGVVALCWGLSGSAGAQEGEALQRAIALFAEGKWEKAVVELSRVIETGELSQEERSQARMALAQTYLGLGEEEKALEVFKAIVRGNPSFAMRFLGAEEVSTDLIRYFGQAALEVRYEEWEALRARLMHTSRSAAVLRSALVPGWGQRYLGHTRRGIVVAGLTAASIAYAVIADRSYREARESYEGAPQGLPPSEFDRRYEDYASEADRADLALGGVAALWILNILDAATQGPNIPELPGGLTFKVSEVHGGVCLAYGIRF